MIPTLTICVISRNLMNAHTSMCLNKIISNQKLLNQYNIFQKMLIGCSTLHISRSIALTEWYKYSGNNDLFLFIDADQTFTPNDILKAITLLNTSNSDVVCGAYARHDGDMTVKAYDPVIFKQDKEGPIKYGATGFMLISKTILDKIDIMPVYVDENHKGIIPYFQPKIISENCVNLWLAEDYSFCWLVKQYNGKIYGFISPTIGHILSKEVFLSSTT